MSLANSITFQLSVNPCAIQNEWDILKNKKSRLLGAVFNSLKQEFLVLTPFSGWNTHYESANVGVCRTTLLSPAASVGSPL